MAIEHIIDQVDKETTMLSKETKAVPRKCSKLTVGDIILTTRPGDTARVFNVHVEGDYTHITYGSEESKLSDKFLNDFKILYVEKNTLN